MVHLFQRTLLKGYLPAAPFPDGASIDNKIAVGTSRACANGDSLSRLKKGFKEHAQAIRNGIRQFLRRQLWQGCGLFALCRTSNTSSVTTTYACSTASSTSLLRPTSRGAFEDTGDARGRFLFVQAILDGSWHALPGCLVEVISTISELTRCRK